MKHIVENATNASYVQDAFKKELNKRIAEEIHVEYPSLVDENYLGESFVPVIANTESDIFWDVNESKYFNAESKEHLTESEVAELGLSENFQCHNFELARTSMDIVEHAITGNLDALQESMGKAFEQSFQAMIEEAESDVDEDSVPISEAQIITKVNSRGERNRRLACRPGYKLQNGVCVIVQGDQKINKKRAAIKAARTKRSQGAGYALKVAKKAKKAMSKRKSLGLDQ